ncbi:MAG: M23 family metallopeptidase, partial [Gammaproteobacteria bacterium]
TLDTQSAQLAALRQATRQEIAALAKRVAEMQSRLLRLDALGERVSVVAKLDQGEFDFSVPPAVGGPEAALPASGTTIPALSLEIDRLSAIVASREQQLDILSGLLADRQIRQEEFLAGRPINSGWMSSAFGRRTDPFHGTPSWHSGVDFAGRLGSDIVAVAGGVVTVSGERSGYGRMVEVNHGNGYTSRYAHNQKNLVAVGDIVKKGQVIALMGSSGRSTGPHVHFEVYKNGRVVDPASYVYRTLRR